MVFGDPQQTMPTRALLHRLRQSTGAAAGPDANLELLLTAGELTQGLLDTEFAASGHDEWTPIAEACADLCTAAARQLLHAKTELTSAALERLQSMELPAELTIKLPEGFAFYGLSPELYQAAARRWHQQHPATSVVVIGLRSIGCTLGGMVAAELSPVFPLVTFRPCGHPFHRRIEVGPQLTERLLSVHSAHFVIVDEGPGLSGSSFNSVADWLEEHGVPCERIHFLPSHRGELGPHAQPRHQERWSRCTRTVVEVPELLPAWQFETARPNSELGLLDIAAGEWRREKFPTENSWPPVDAMLERRKYLYDLDARRWLAKYVGMGHYGDEKVRMAAALAEARFSPAIRGFQQGFLIQEWLTDAVPLPIADDIDRGELLDFVGDYLAFRFRTFPVSRQYGATAGELLQMARVNVENAMGPDVAGQLDRWELPPEPLVRTLTDNRMHAWEFLVLPDGRFQKTDGVDHHAAHDLIGAQDLHWDIAGAIVELDLSPAEAKHLRQRLLHGCEFRPDIRRLEFCLDCYLAFQLGALVMATAMANPTEVVRLRTASETYKERLRQRLLIGQRPAVEIRARSSC